MVNLDREYLLLKNEIEPSLQTILESGRYIQGPYIERFESEWAAYLNSNFLISCANGTDALQIALMALELSAGDEIIMPSYGYVSAAEVAILLGFIPVFVDVGMDYNLNIEFLNDAISSRTKCIIPIHLFGLPANMSRLLALADEHGIYVVEDAAQAAGADVQINGTMHKAGSVGTIGCFSHFPTKNLGCFGDGGSLCTNDEKLAAKLKMLTAHGQNRKYFHDIIGLNSRLDALQAAILSAKLPYLDQFNRQRRNNALLYAKYFESNHNILLPEYNENHIYHQFTIQCDRPYRDRIKLALMEKGIASMIYYPLPMSRQKAFQGKARIHSDTNAQLLCERSLSLPMNSTLTSEEIEYICTVINTI